MSEIVRLRILQIVAQHKGRHNAIPRRELIDKLRHFCTDLNDRKIREAYSSLPIATCEDGLFIPQSTAEVEGFREYLRPKMGPELVAARVGIIYATYPNLVKEFGRQTDLFQQGAEA